MGAGFHGGFGGTNGSKDNNSNMKNYAKAKTPIEKFTKYSLDYDNKNAAGKAEAYEKGLGSVIMGIFDEAKAASLLELPENQEVAVLIPVGIPDE